MDAEPSVEARDAEEFDRLLRFMTRPGRRFGLALATYADERVAQERRDLATTRASDASVRTTTVAVDPSQRIANRLVAAADGFDVLFVIGLDDIARDVAETGPLTRAVGDLNFQRDTLPDLLDVRIVFWVSLDAYAQLVRLAPDLLDVMLTRFEFLTEHERLPDPEPAPERPAWMTASPGVAVSVLAEQAESFAASARNAENELTKADAAASAGQLFASIDRLDEAAQWLAEAAAGYERLATRDGDAQLMLAAAIALRHDAEVEALRGNNDAARRLAERSVELLGEGGQVPASVSLEQLRSLGVLATLRGEQPTGQDDWQLLERWQAGDRHAGNQLVARNYSPLRAYMTRRAPEDDVEELIQETFLRLLAHRMRAPENRARFRTTLWSIARNVVVEYYRRRHANLDQHVSDLDELSSQTESEEDRLAAITEANLLLQALELIPDRDREILELRYWAQLPGPELAARYGLTLATIASRLRVAKQRLLQAYQSLTARPTLDDAALAQSLARLRASIFT